MRLPKELVTIVTRGILRHLIERKIISSENVRDTQQKLEKIVFLDLEKDEEFLREAKSVLDKKMAEIKEVKDLDYHLLLLKAKKEIASKENFVVWGGEGKFSTEKINQLSKDFANFFENDDLIEYYVKKEDLFKEIKRSFENEMNRDKKREIMAEEKVRSIKRNIAKGTSEYDTLKEQFYREFLSKEA